MSDLAPQRIGADPVDSAGAGSDVGARLRQLRRERGIPARAVAAALEISPSAVSQIERGVLQPSVSRLLAFTDALGVPLAAVFENAETEPAASLAAEIDGFSLVRAAQSTTVELGDGVTFRRLSPGPSPGIDYFQSTYPAGASAHPATDLFRHDGYEVGTMISGELTIDFPDERVVLRPGDAISYPCSRPHRIHNAGAEPAVATWLIVHAPA